MVQANFSFHYADPHYGGLLAATYLPQAPVSTPFVSDIEQFPCIEMQIPSGSLSFSFICPSDLNSLNLFCRHAILKW